MLTPCLSTLRASRRNGFALIIACAVTCGASAEANIWMPINAAELDAAVVAAQPGDEIVVSPGTYYLLRPLWMHTPRVTIRGATGKRDDVVLHGSGMNAPGVNEGISVGADDVVIQDLTVKDFYWNGIHTRAENDVDRTVIANVRTWNIGERHIKGSRNPFDVYTMSDDILIESVHMLQTTPRDHRGNPDYIGGIDMMAVNRLVVRHVVAEGIRGHFNGGNAAIFLWNGVTDVVVEQNRIFDCAKGIALGNPYRPGPFAGTGGNGEPGEHHARGGIIRNNMVRRGVWTSGGNHIGLELASTRDVGVFHNTFYSDLATYFRLVSISHEGAVDATENVVLAYNILRGHLFDLAGEGWNAVGNIHDVTGNTVTPDWFVDPSVAHFHLTSAASPAIDQAPPFAEVPDDFDSEGRAQNGASEIGADEYAVSTPTILTVSPTTVATWAMMTVTWSGIPGASPTDWLGLFTLGSADTELMAWIYVSCAHVPDVPRASGSCEFVIPNVVPGPYEMRLFANDGFTSLATSYAFEVIDRDAVRSDEVENDRR
jgi:hypothetical protein